MSTAAEAITEPVVVGEADEVEHQALEIVEQSKAITILDDLDYENAGAFLRDNVKLVRRKIDAMFDPVIKASHLAHKEAVGAKKQLTAPLLEAERLVKSAMGTYYQKQQAEIRRAEQERLKAAREEAERRQLEEAAELEDAGRNVEAEAKIEEPVMPVVTSPAPAAPKAAGTSVRMVKKFRIINAAAIDRKFLIPDEKKIGQLVRSLGADAETLVGGIEVYEEASVSARG